MNIELSKNGAKGIFMNDLLIEFYYTEETEGVIIQEKNYPWMDGLPMMYIKAINQLMTAYHEYRENVLKLDKWLKPIKQPTNQIKL